jgi:1-acyl-sn-glycerol-3-phosphate acyltransferase
MKFLNHLIYTLSKLWMFGVFLTSLLFFGPVFYLLIKLKKFKTTLKAEKLWGKITLPLMGLFVEVIDEHNFPEPPYIICPNHGSYLDILTMFNTIPHYFIFMGKAELKNWFLIRQFFISGMNIMVDRNSKMGSARAFIQARKAIRRNESIVIFPEATIPNTVPLMKDFKDGAFVMAIKEQIPIVPITILDNYNRLRTGAFFKERGSFGKSRSIIHPAINTKGLSENDLVNLHQQVFDTIQQPFLNLNNEN